MNIHITRGEESFGPYSLEQVQSYLADGLLLPTDLAWQEGMEDWVPLSEFLGQSAAPMTHEIPPKLTRHSQKTKLGLAILAIILFAVPKVHEYL